MQKVTLPATRIVRGATGATLTHQFVDADGEPAAPSGTVTVAVTRSDGTAVTVGSVTGSTTAARSVTIGVSELADVDWLSAVWSDDGTAVATDTIEVVGGVLISHAAASVLDPTLASKDTVFPAARRAAEDVLTVELGRSPFERFYTERVNGTGTSNLRVTWPDIQGLVWARTWTNTTSTDLTVSEVASIISDDGRMLRRTDGKPWPCGTNNIEVGYRFGMRALPNDIARHVPLMIRHQINVLATGSHYQSETIRTADGIIVSLARPGIGQSITGNDEVDATIRRHRFAQALVA